jgi:hypothetical protein
MKDEMCDMFVRQQTCSHVVDGKTEGRRQLGNAGIHEVIILKQMLKNVNFQTFAVVHNFALIFFMGDYPASG